MSYIPKFELGILNAWIFMIWWIIFPFFLKYIIKEKKVYENLSASIPMKFEKLSNFLWLTALIGGLILSIFLPLQLNTNFFYIGLFIFFFGLIINLTVRYTWRNTKPDKPFTTGPYRYSRHPIYFSFILIYISIAIMSYSWIFLVIMVLYILHLLLVVTAEERYCLKMYGKEYQDYMERTSRWIGFPETRR